MVKQADVMDYFMKMLAEWDVKLKQWINRRKCAPDFFPRRALTLPEKYARLAAIHSAFCEDTKRIDPWKSHKTIRQLGMAKVLAGILFVALRHHARGLGDKDRGAVEKMLRDVEVNLQRREAAIEPVRPLPRKPLPGGAHADRSWLKWVANLLRVVTEESIPGDNRGFVVLRNDNFNRVKQLADKLSVVREDHNGQYHSSASFKAAVQTFQQNTGHMLAGVIDTLEKALRQGADGDEAQLPADLVELARSAIPVLETHAKLSLTEQVAELRGRADAPSCQLPDDLRPLEGWAKRLDAWLQSDKPQNRHVSMIFRPDRMARDAMMKLSVPYPQVIKQIDDAVDFANKWFDRLSEGGAAAENLGNAMLTLLGRINTGVRTIMEAQPTAALPADPASTPGDAGFSVAALREMTGLENTALNRYAKKAGVETPARGQRSHLYPAADARLILQKIINTSSEAKLRNRCQTALRNLPEITE